MNNRLFTYGLAAIFLWSGLMGCSHSSGSAGGDSSQVTTDQKSTSARWQKLPIEYKIASTVPTQFHADIHAAFNEWNIAAGKAVFVFAGIKNLGEGELAPDYTVHQNVVMITNRSGAMASGADASGDIGPLARTFLYGISEIQDADIYLFDFDQNYVSGRAGTGDVYSVRSVVMHEAGHMLLGSEHSSDPDSIMTAVLYPKSNPQEKLGLAPSDMERLFEVYGDQL